MVQSIGHTGVCWDNSVAESSWSSLKGELVHHYRSPHRATARRAIFAWINPDNRLRPHSNLGYLPPLQRQTRYPQPQTDPVAQPT